MSGCYPEGTSLAAQGSIGMSGGCPEGTTLATEYNVGLSGLTDFGQRVSCRHINIPTWMLISMGVMAMAHIKLHNILDL